jgi:signal peptidase I
VTAGQHGGPDYGQDHQTYPPYHSDPDQQPGWDGRQPAGGYRGGEPRPADPRDYRSAPQSPYPAGASYPVRPEYPPRSPGAPPPSYPPGPSYAGYPPRSPAVPPGPSYPPRSPGPSYGSYQGDGSYPADRRAAVPVGSGRQEAFGEPRYRASVRPPNGRDGRPPSTRPEDGSERAPGRRKRRGLPLWQELPLLLIIAFCLAILVRTFLLQAFYIPSGSMEDTLIAGDRVLVNKVVYQFREPARGEVVVFRGTDAWASEQTEEGDIGAFASVGRALGDLVGVSRPGEKDFIKRVIGLPGDTVSCCDVDGRVFVNGQPLDESYVIRNSPLDEGGAATNDCRSRRFDEIVVQPGHMFVMGDHRQVSQDSRCQGQVPIENIIGRAFIIVWPSGRWDSLSQPDTFDNVPSAATASGPVVVPATGPPELLAFALPILLPFGWTFRRNSARSRLIGRRSVCRLAE